MSDNKPRLDESKPAANQNASGDPSLKSNDANDSSHGPGKQLEEPQKTIAVPTIQKGPPLPPTKSAAASSIGISSQQMAFAETGLLEENSLPPSTNPAGAYAPLYREKRKKEIDSSAIVPLPPRVIGGLRDQIKRSKRCICKNTQCLKLYCECFNSGVLCTGQCSCVGCFNDGSAENARVRTQAVLNALIRDPLAFRPPLSTGNVRPPSAKRARPGTTAVDSPLAVAKNELPPSYYTVPMKIGDTPVSGLSFSRAATPIGRPPPQRQRNMGVSNRRFVPSPTNGANKKILSVPSKRKYYAIAEETELDKMWREETNKVARFFGTMRCEYDRRLNHEGPQQLLGLLDQEALHTLKSVEEDMKTVQNVVDAAELDVRTRLRGGRRGGASSVGTGRRVQTDPLSNEEESHLLCDEEIPTWQPNKLEGEKLKELTILAAQDAALLRETARIVRRKTRELCEKRSRS